MATVGSGVGVGVGTLTIKVGSDAEVTTNAGGALTGGGLARTGAANEAARRAARAQRHSLFMSATSRRRMYGYRALGRTNLLQQLHLANEGCEVGDLLISLAEALFEL
jgi:hypothetical protein